MRFCPLLCGFLISWPCLCAQSVATGAPTPTLRTGTRLVAIPVVVRDRKGALVQGLGKDDFTLQVDQQPAGIRYFDRDNDLPLTLGLMVDTSMSQQSILPVERQASVTFLSTMLQTPAGRDPDRAFVIQFDTEDDLLADLTDQKPRLEAGLGLLASPCDRALKKLQEAKTQGEAGARRHGRPGDLPMGQGRGLRGLIGTTLYDAVYLAANEIMDKQLGRKALILLTDGGDYGSKKTIKDAIEAAQRSDTVIYAIYFEGDGNLRDCVQSLRGAGAGLGAGASLMAGPGDGQFGGGNAGPDDGKRVLRQMAEETGGRMFQVKGSNTVNTIYAQIGEELRSQYRLGFSPAMDLNDGYHKILVATPQGKKVKVQARDGFYVGR